MGVLLLLSTVAVGRAEAYAPPAESITTASAHVAAATAGDPTLANLAADLNTPTLQAEGSEVFASLAAMNQTYAGGTDPAASILSSPTYLADEPAMATAINGTLAGATDSTATAALVGGDVLDAAAGLAIVPEAAAAATILPELAVGAAALGVIAITTGSGTKVIDLLGGGNADASVLGPLTADVTQVRWVSMPEDGHNLCAPNYPYQTPWCNGAASSWTGVDNTQEPLMPNVPGHSVYVMEDKTSPPQGGSTNPNGWIFSSDEVFAGTPSAATALPQGYQGDCTWNGNHYTNMQGTYGVSGWAPSGLAKSTFLIGPDNGAMLPSYYVCTPAPTPHHALSAVIRPGGLTKLGTPHAGTVPASVTPVAATPLDTAGKLGAAVAALPADLAAHPTTANTIDGSLGAQVGGSVVTVPGVFSIPAIKPYELATDYATDLANAGFTNVSTTVVTSPNADPARGPNEAIGVSPKVGTATAPDTAVRISANPADAPYPAADPAGSSTGAATGGTPSIDFSPLNVPLTNKFPFGVPGYVATFLGGWSGGGGGCPDWGVGLPFGQRLDVNMCSFQPVIDIYRPVLILASFIALAWQFFSVALGMGSTGEDS